MHLHWIKPLIGVPGPFATVYIDATRGTETGYREVVNRWQALRRSLKQQGAPELLLELIDERITAPTHEHGPAGRVVIAANSEIYVDRYLRTPPQRDDATYASAPALVAAARASEDSVDYLIAAVDRLGVDIYASRPDHPGGKPLPQHSIDGDHDEVHKIRGGGFHHKRLQNRAEDSWERNAESTAVEINRLVEKNKPELLLLTGDIRAVGLVTDRLAESSRRIVCQVPGGERGEANDDQSFSQRLEDVLDEHREERRQRVIDLYRQEHGRDEAAVTGIDDVLNSLRRGQVAELLLSETDSGERPVDLELWIGSTALAIAENPDEIRDLGEEPEALRGDIALLRAAVGQEAGVTFANDDLPLVEGVGAVLRWSDASTPGETAVSLSDDAQRMS